MLKNVGVLDRWLRVIAGVFLISLVFTGPRSSWGWLGLVPLITGLTGSCMVYRMFGWSTRRTRSAI